MSRNCAIEILKHLMAHYPKEYPESMSEDRIKRTISDFITVYVGYSDEMVLKAYKDYTLEKIYAPKVAEILKILKERKSFEERIEQEIHPEQKTDDKYEYCVIDGIKYRMELVKDYYKANGYTYDAVKYIPVGRVMQQ